MLLIKYFKHYIICDIYSSFKARGLSASLKKELRENGTQWRGATSANNDEEGEKFDTFKAELHENVEIIKLDNNFCINHQEIPEDEPEIKPFPLSSSPQRVAITQQRKPNRYVLLYYFDCSPKNIYYGKIRDVHFS